MRHNGIRTTKNVFSKEAAERSLGRIIMKTKKLHQIKLNASNLHFLIIQKILKNC